MSVTPSHSHSPRLSYARGIVFFTSLCLMVIEIVASRITAPYVGVSLYTWTGIIGVILFGYTLGSALGGSLADRKSSRHWLGGSIALGGIFTLVLILIAPWLGPLLASASIPLWCYVLIFCLIIFLPAAFCLSTVPPQLLKLVLDDVAKTGATVGSIGAWNAGGSILGTYLAGFILLQYFSVNLILSIVGGGLILLGIGVAFTRALSKS